MQLNIHVPKDREGTMLDLSRLTARLGTPKNLFVLDAIEAHLEHCARHEAERGEIQLPAFDLGIPGHSIRRADVYDEWPRL